jgi:hypothetical protein
MASEPICGSGRSSSSKGRWGPVHPARNRPADRQSGASVAGQAAVKGNRMVQLTAPQRERDLVESRALAGLKWIHH